MSGGIASLAVAFGEYLGSFVPFFSTANVLLTVGGWRMSGALFAIAALGWLMPAPVHPDWTPALPSSATASAFGVAMIAVFWSYDGWYCATFSAGETRDPGATCLAG